jgi:hypothetical protein
MMDTEEFCPAFGIDPAAAKATLARDPADDDHPWYVQAMLALGSWITALVVVAFCCFFLSLVFDLEEGSFGAVLTAVGAAFFALGFAMLLRGKSGVFAAHFATAMAAAGQAMAAVGVGIFADEIWAAALASLPFAAAVALWLPSRALQGLSSAWAAILVLVALHDQNFPFMFEAAAIGVAAGVALHLYPPRRDLAPTAVVLLLVGPLLSIMFDFQNDLGISGFAVEGWASLAIFVGLILFLVYSMWTRVLGRTGQIELALFAAAAVAVSIVMPPGAAAALVILVLAFALGSHLLALIGVLLEIYFLWKFYYDLDMTLLHKSYLLVGVGIVLLIIWGLLARINTKAAAS